MTEDSDPDTVRFEEADDGGMELVFPDELLDILDIEYGHEVDFRVVTVDKTDVQFEIDFNTDVSETQLEELRELLGENITVAD